MNRTFFVAFGLVASLILLSGGVVATPTPDATNDENASTVIAEIGPRVQLLDWEVRGGTFRVLLDAEVPERVVISDALGPLATEGVVEIPQRDLFIDGKQWVEMDVTTYEGAAGISVATSSGAIYLSTGVSDDNPFRYFGGTSGLMSGVLMSMGISVGAAMFVIWREDSGVIQA